MQAPLTLRGRGRRGRRSQSPWELSSRVSMSRGTFGSEKYLVRDTQVQAKLYFQDRRPGDRSVRFLVFVTSGQEEVTKSARSVDRRTFAGQRRPPLFGRQ